MQRKYAETESDTKSEIIVIHSDNIRLSQTNGAMLTAIFTKIQQNYEVQLYHNTNQ